MSCTPASLTTVRPSPRKIYPGMMPSTWAAVSGPSRPPSARRLLEIREAEELAEKVFVKVERMPKGKAHDEAFSDLRRAQELPDAEAILILKAILEK